MCTYKKNSSIQKIRIRIIINYNTLEILLHSHMFYDLSHEHDRHKIRIRIIKNFCIENLTIISSVLQSKL